MIFRMGCSISASKSLEGIDFSGILGEAEKVLSKGAPAGSGAKIEECRVDGSRIDLFITSRGHIRPHNAIFNLRNYMASNIGSKHHIGLREIAIREYVIETEIESAPKGEIKLPFCNVRIEGKKAVFEFKDLTEEFIGSNVIDRILTRFSEKIKTGGMAGKKEFTKLIESSDKKDYALPCDPTQEIIDRGWVKEFPGAGVWIMMPPYTALIRAIYDLCLEDIAKKMGFAEVFLPRLIPLDVERKKGHLNIPNEIFWVCPPESRDPEFFEEYSDLVEITRSPHPDKLKEKLREPMFGLAYAQCEPFYQIFEGHRIDSDRDIWKVYDVNGPTWRWEGGGIKGLERLNEFHRIEFMFVGKPEDVVGTRDALLKEARRIVESLDLQWKIESTTAVYLEHAGKIEEEKSNYVKTYDLSAILPFKTQSRDEKELEIASFHVHEDFYAKRFHWKEKKDRPVWSGCAGIGPTRWAFAFIARHGFDFDNWPAEIKNRIGKLPGVPESDNWPKIR